MTKLNFDDDLVPFWVSSISSQNGREESISSTMEKTWFLPSMEETCQPWFVNVFTEVVLKIITKFAWF